MNILDIIEKLDQTEANKSWVDSTTLAEALLLDIPYVDAERISAYWFGKWRCTDTEVGYRVYFLDENPVAFSIQSGRKSDERFFWKSENDANAVRNYLISLVEPKTSELTFWDETEDLRDGFKIGFNKELVRNEFVTYKNEPVHIEHLHTKNNYGLDSTVDIRFENQTIKTVEISDLDFGYYLTKEGEDT